MGSEECSESKQKECAERRHTDINVWEKRLTLWFMAALVSIATAQVVEMNTSVQMIKKDIDLNLKKDEGQDGRLENLASEQTRMKMGLNGHEIRLETVEEKLKVTTVPTVPRSRNGEIRFP